VAARKQDPVVRCRRKFLHYFPGGFRDPTYLEWERDYKVAAHRAWRARVEPALAADPTHAAAEAVKVESRTNLLFSYEKMALRDAVKTPASARAFAQALTAFLEGPGPPAARFDAWCAALGDLPRPGTRVVTWPVVTVFGFLAQPKRHLFLKPRVTQRAAEAYDFPFAYASRPSYATYESLLEFGRRVRADLADLAPRDQVDIQSFLWVLGSDEYPD
jgi:hypothetical protein